LRCQKAEYTPEQKHWLVGKYDIFKVHQERKTSGQFFPALYEEYFALWPLTPTPEGIEAAGGNLEIALAKLRRFEEHVRDFVLIKHDLHFKRSQRMYRWMPNRARTKHGANGQGSATGLNLTIGPPRKKAAVQLYVKCYWESKVKPEVIKLWAPTPETDLFGEIDNGEDQVAWEAMTPMEKNIPLWFKMKVGRALYDAESDEIKGKIDRVRALDKEVAVAAELSTVTFATEEERMRAMQHFNE
jgi:hypothetical protein